MSLHDRDKEGFLPRFAPPSTSHVCVACAEISEMYQQMRESRDTSNLLASDLEEKWLMAELRVKIAENETARLHEQEAHNKFVYERQMHALREENKRLAWEASRVPIMPPPPTYMIPQTPGFSFANYTLSPHRLPPTFHTLPAAHLPIGAPAPPSPSTYMQAAPLREPEAVSPAETVTIDDGGVSASASYAQIAARRTVEQSSWSRGRSSSTSPTAADGDSGMLSSATPPYTPKSTGGHEEAARRHLGHTNGSPTHNPSPLPVTARSPSACAAVESLMNARSPPPPLPTTFAAMQLTPALRYAVTNYGLIRPSKLQATVIPAVMNKGNLLVVTPMQCNTDKAVAIAIGAINRVNVATKRTQVIIVTPTRETASMLASIMGTLASSQAITIVRAIGGRGIWHDVSELRDGAHVVIATPARLHHLLNENEFHRDPRLVLDVSRVRSMMIDDADELFSRGSKLKLYAIFDKLPQACQKVLFASALVGDVDEAIARRMPNTRTLTIDTRNVHLVQCQRQFVHVFRTHHGMLSQPERVSVVRHFASKLSASSSTSKAGGTVLIATDLMARGIETEPVPFVVNFDVPGYREYYLPRVGRVSSTGVAFSLAVAEEMRTLRTIEEAYDTTIANKQYCAKVLHLIARQRWAELDEHS